MICEQKHVAAFTALAMRNNVDLPKRLQKKLGTAERKEESAKRC